MDKATAGFEPACDGIATRCLNDSATQPCLVGAGMVDRTHATGLEAPQSTANLYPHCWCRRGESNSLLVVGSHLCSRYTTSARFLHCTCMGRWWDLNPRLLESRSSSLTMLTDTLHAFREVEARGSEPPLTGLQIRGSSGLCNAPIGMAGPGSFDLPTCGSRIHHYTPAKPRTRGWAGSAGVDPAFPNRQFGLMTAILRARDDVRYTGT